MAFCYKPQKNCTMNCDSKSHGLRMDLEETVSEMEKRHSELANRRHYLTEKIMNMEKTMPILVAHKFWNSGQRDNISFDKIQQLVDQLSPYPYPNPTEKLLKETNDKLHCLDEETRQLHDKIIEIDIKIEETGMELESLLLVNNELDEKLKSIEAKGMEKERRARAFPDLHEIDPEDVACLGRIRQLVQQEIRLKNCINALEDRETRLQGQLNQLLPANKESKKSPKAGIKDSKRRNKKEVCKSIDHSKISGRVHSSSTRDDMCHCGSEASFYQDNSSSDMDCKYTDDDSSNEEYWECCDCEG